MSLLQATGVAAPAGPPGVYFVLAGDRAVQEGLAVAERLRDALPDIAIEVNLGGGSFKSQLRRADRSHARLALIIGDDEVARRTVALKSLRATGTQQECAWEELPARVGTLLRNEDGR